jgi:lysophospholipase L1-like esterase
MKYKKAQWMILYILSFCSFLLFACGCVLAVTDLLGDAGTKVEPKPTLKLASVQRGGMLLGLGDSLTRGIGDTNGQGYFGLIKNELAKKHPASLSAANLSVSGLTSDQLLTQVRKPQTQNLIKQAQWIVITIGGNDLFRGSGSLKTIDVEAAKKSQIRYKKNLDTILSQIKKANPNAYVFLFGLYNPFGDLPEEKTATALVTAWNETMIQTAAQYDRVVVIPTFDLFALDPKKYLYSDHFHPNQIGYKRMADRLWQVIQDQPGEGKNTDGK